MYIIKHNGIKNVFDIFAVFFFYDVTENLMTRAAMQRGEENDVTS
jgi:hypothetical protein